MTSTRIRTSKAGPRQRSVRCQRRRRGSRSCCGDRIEAKIEELLHNHQRIAISKSLETVYNKFLLKFIQYRPRIQSVKSRLQESCELLSEIDELLDFFCDPQRLWAYLLDEKPQTQTENTDQSSPGEIQPMSENSELQNLCGSKTISREAHCLEKPVVETIAGGEAWNQSSRTFCQQTQGIRGEETLPRTRELFTRAFQLRSPQKRTPEAASFAMPQNDRSEPVNTVAWNRYSKRFKTSTPAEHSSPSRVSPPNLSLIVDHRIQCDRRRRKAMMIEPPEEDGAWTGTPVIRNQTTCAPLSSNVTGKIGIETNSNDKDSVSSVLVPIISQQTEDGKGAIFDAGQSTRAACGAKRKQRASGEISEEPEKGKMERPSSGATTQVVIRAQRAAKKVGASKSEPVPTPTVVGAAGAFPNGGLARDQFRSERSFRKAVTNAHSNDPICKNKRK